MNTRTDHYGQRVGTNACWWRASTRRVALSDTNTSSKKMPNGWCTREYILKRMQSAATPLRCDKLHGTMLSSMKAALFTTPSSNLRGQSTADNHTGEQYSIRGSTKQLKKTTQNINWTKHSPSPSYKSNLLRKSRDYRPDMILKGQLSIQSNTKNDKLWYFFNFQHHQIWGQET